MKYDASQVQTDWLQRLQHNDDQALALIMKKYYNSLYNYAFRFLPDEVFECSIRRFPAVVVL